MPIYEYQCQSCEKVFEYMQRMADDPKTECEACQGALERLISQSAFHLKGGGWYKDLYSSVKKDDAGGESSTPTSSKAAAADSGATDSGTSTPKSEAAPKTAKPATATPSKTSASKD